VTSVELGSPSVCRWRGFPIGNCVDLHFGAHGRANRFAEAAVFVDHRRGCLRRLAMREVADASQHEPAMKKYS
jgi:hypothetical protein